MKEVSDNDGEQRGAGRRVDSFLRIFFLVDWPLHLHSSYRDYIVHISCQNFLLRILLEMWGTA